MFIDILSATNPFYRRQLIEINHKKLPEPPNELAQKLYLKRLSTLIKARQHKYGVAAHKILQNIIPDTNLIYYATIMLKKTYILNTDGPTYKSESFAFKIVIDLPIYMSLFRHKCVKMTQRTISKKN